jgi:antitoxin HigA-1
MAITREDLEAGRLDLSDVAGAPARAALPTPGEILAKEFLEPNGITAYRLARDIGVPPNRITGIINGTRAISPETALRLARYFGTSAQSWINLQTRHDLALAQREHGREIARTVRPLAA